MPPHSALALRLRSALAAAVAACLATAAQPARGASGALFVASDGDSLELYASLFDPRSNSSAPSTPFPVYSCMMHPEGATLLADGDTVALSVRDLGLTRAALLLDSPRARPMSARAVPTQAWCYLAWQTDASSVWCLADDEPTPKTDRTQLWRVDLGTGRNTLVKSFLFGFAPSEAFAFDSASSSVTGVYYNLSAGGLQQVLFTVDASTGETLHAAPVPTGTTFLQLKVAGDGRLLSVVSDASGTFMCAVDRATAAATPLPKSADLSKFGTFYSTAALAPGVLYVMAAAPSPAVELRGPPTSTPYLVALDAATGEMLDVVEFESISALLRWVDS
jgi:hypothetical protein